MNQRQPPVAVDDAANDRFDEPPPLVVPTHPELDERARIEIHQRLLERHARARRIVGVDELDEAEALSIGPLVIQ